MVHSFEKFGVFVDVADDFHLFTASIINQPPANFERAILEDDLQIGFAVSDDIPS